MTSVEASRPKFDRSILKPSRAQGYYQVIGNVSAFAVVLVLASYANQFWQMVPLVLAIGCVQHKLFFPVHDCIHYSLFPTKSENRFYGGLCSAMIGTSFEAIRVQHMAHHRDFGHDYDPGASDYYVRFESRWQFIMFLFGPLVGTILFSKFFDYISRPATSGISQNRHQGAPSRILQKAVPYLVLLLVQLGIFATLTQGFKLEELWRYAVFNILPLATVFLFFNRLRMFLEHGSLDYEVCDYLTGKRRTARTIYASWLERLLVCGGSFNYHHEHHKYPNIPGWRLPEVHERMLPNIDAQDVRETYFQACMERWKNLPWSANNNRD